MFPRRNEIPSRVSLTPIVAPAISNTKTSDSVKVPNRPLRVAFIGGRGVVSKYSGIDAYYEEVGGRLAGMGHEVTAYCRTYFTPPIKEHNGMRVVRLPTIRTKHLETVVHTFLSTLHVLMHPCDVVHYHALRGGYGIGRAPNCRAQSKLNFPL